MYVGMYTILHICVHAKLIFNYNTVLYYCVGPEKVRLVKDSSPSPSNTSAISQSNVSTTSTSTSENTSQKGTSVCICMCVRLHVRTCLHVCALVHAHNNHL